ncbi:MAG: hypothetical protein HN590_01435 [Calditrichaeota bacterium]|nr:hypothetical protein [Calditrichota bacterium]
MIFQNRFFQILLVLIFATVSIFSLSSCYCKAKQVSGCNNSENVDPMKDSGGDFLDVDLSILEQNAYQEYQAKNYKESAGLYLKALQYNIDDSNSIYNLACCYGLLGEKELAAKYLERAIKAGFEDIEHVKQDPDFENVRDSDSFKSVVDKAAGKIKKKNEALGDIGYVEAPLLQKYRLHLPDNYDSTKKYPLIVGLHGFGHNADGFIQLWERFGESEIIYAALEAPYLLSGRPNAGFSWITWIPGVEGLAPGCAEMSEQLIANTVSKLQSEFRIDGTYLLGFSQGCGFAFSAGIKHHENISGMICFGGWLDDEISDEALAAAKNLRVFIGHGTEDTMVKYEAATTARDRLVKSGYEVKFVNFKGGHTIQEDALKQAIEWMGKP